MADSFAEAMRDAIRALRDAGWHDEDFARLVTDVDIPTTEDEVRQAREALRRYNNRPTTPPTYRVEY